MSTGGPVSTWYTNSYSGPFRSTRLRSHSLLAASARPMPQQTLVVDAATRNAGNAGGGAAAGNGDKEDKSQVRRRETIFGPDVGEDDEPGWTKPEDGVKVSVDTVKGWVERVKGEEGLHSTTTLQALVNLKRPTLLLQQLEHEQPGSASSTEIEPKPVATEAAADPYHHGPPVHILKFNYDAMTPRVNITLSIHPTPVTAPAEEEGAKSVIEEDVKVIYSGTHAGGFNQLFTLPSHAAIDLSSAIAPMPAPGEEQDMADLQDKKDGDMSQGAGSGGASGAVRESEDTTRSSFDRNNMMLHRNSTTGALQTVPELGGQDGGVPPTIPENGEARTNTGRRRFGLFGRRDRERDAEQGQIEMSAQGNSAQGEGEDAAPKEPERGMRLLIKIEAISDEGQGLSRRNAQLTHILINGMWASDGTSPTGKRVWLVKVVRREAVIGAHTFLLKEIYGLSSSQAAQSASYPPAAGAAEDPYASTPNECIVCLTSPRDVVLLPCRHLVVCRDCAVGMVEFGAGGKVARREGDASGDVAGGGDAAAAGGAATTTGGANAAATGAAAPPVAGGTTERGRERRKKKAKGWYCPVCRQPYTSLLRLALPASAKPLRTPGASRMPSRAPSIRSHHTTHAHDGETNSLRRVPSIAPTLPDGAERMLEALRPAGADDDESEDDEAAAHEHNRAHDVERPQFVLGEEVDTAEHAHVQLPSTTTAPALAPVSSAPGDKDKAEVEHNESIEHGMQDVSLNDEPVAKHEAKQ